VPEEWTCRTTIEEAEVYCIKDWDPFEEFDSTKDTYIEGSGGIDSSDPRVRSRGAYWVQPLEAPHQEWDCVGMYTTVSVLQAVPWSELTALSCFLFVVQSGNMVP